MLCKRIIPCLDVKNNRVVKGINFLNLSDAGDALALGRKYYEESADELVFLDISATVEGRETTVGLARKVAEEISIPFTIGGGVRTIDDMNRLLKAGADKFSINSAAIEDPNLIKKASREFGSQAVVVAIDTKKIGSGWRIYKNAGKVQTKLDAVEWAEKSAALGAGEILLTSMDCDGKREGYDLELLRDISERVSIPLIASGGAGSKRHFLDVFKKTKVSAALAAGLFHYGELRICELKKYLLKNGVMVRET
ncbi:MAG: imidazole glycerol phosphate synthase subunit HisF [Candidatus Micrarchaeota archaeon]